MAFDIALRSPGSGFNIVLSVTAGGTIYTRTLQDLTSISVTDPADLPLRLRERIQNDLLAVDWSAETRHKRTVSILNTIDDFLDQLTATKSAAPATAVIQELITLLDFIETLRLRDRSLPDSITLQDDSIELRLRFRTLADTLALTDGAIAVLAGRIITQALSDILAVTDNAIERRLRYRTLQDTLRSTDAMVWDRLANRVLLNTITSTDRISRELHRLKFDSMVVTDNVIELRLRRRLLIDGIDLTDVAIPTTSGINIRFKVTTDNSVVIDTNLPLRLRDRKSTDTAASTDTVTAIKLRPRKAAETLVVGDAKVMRRLRRRKFQDTSSVVDTSVPLRLRDRKIADGIAGRTNILWPSNDFTSARWTKQTNVTLNGLVQGPFGQTDAMEIDWTAAAANLGIYQAGAQTDPIGTMFTHALWIRSDTPGNGLARLTCPNASTNFFDITVTTIWQRLNGSFITAASSHGSWLKKQAGGPNIIQIYEWQLEEGAEATALIHTDTAKVTEYLHDATAILRARDRALADALTATDATDTYRLRIRVLLDSLSVTDAIRLESAIIKVLIAEGIDVTDAVFSEKAYSLVLFFIRHGLSTLDIDTGVVKDYIVGTEYGTEELNVIHEVENKHIIHGIRRTT